MTYYLVVFFLYLFFVQSPKIFFYAILHLWSDVVAFEDLDDIFGGTSTTTTKTEEKPKATPKAESKSEPKQEPKAEATKSETTTDETDDVEIDFSALADMDMSSLNLGE